MQFTIYIHDWCLSIQRFLLKKLYAMAEKSVDTELSADSYNHTVESLHLSYPSSQCEAIITEISEELNETKLYFYFKKKCGGKIVTDINSFEIDGGRQTAHLTFEDRESMF